MCVTHEYSNYNEFFCGQMLLYWLLCLYRSLRRYIDIVLWLSLCGDFYLQALYNKILIRILQGSGHLSKEMRAFFKLLELDCHG